jgi:L-lactate dehydrogenase (cytochrome)
MGTAPSPASPTCASSRGAGCRVRCSTTSIAALPRVVDAVAGHSEIEGWRHHLRPGQALGSRARRARLFGRQGRLYGLAAGGQAGVELALALIRKELEISMAPCGVTDVRHVGRQVLVP